MCKWLEFVGVVMVACTGWVAIDIYLPSLPAIAHFFETDAQHSQLTIAFYLIPLTFTQLIWGGVSDRLGRRRVLLAALSLSLLGSAVCAVAPSLTWLLLGRFVQGFGSGAATALWRALLRDRYAGSDLASALAYATNFLALVYMIAPTFGGLLQESFGWRANFVFLLAWSALALIMLALFMQEVRVEERERREKHWGRDYLLLLGSRSFLGACLCNFCVYAWLFAWVTIGPSLLIDQMGLTPMAFGLGSAVVTLGLVIGGVIVTLEKRFSSLQKFPLGWLLVIGAGGLFLLEALLGRLSPMLIFTILTIQNIGTTLIITNTSVSALSAFGHLAGTASGLFSFFQMAGGALTSYGLAIVGATGGRTLGVFFVISGGLAWFSYHVLAQRKSGKKRWLAAK